MDKNDRYFKEGVVIPPNFPKKKVLQEATPKQSRKERPLLRAIVILVAILSLICLILGPIAIFNYLQTPTIQKTGTTVISEDTGVVRIKKGMILYGQVNEFTYDGEKYVFEGSVKTPFLTKKAILISTDDICVVLEDRYDLGDGKIHTKEEQDKIIQMIFG